MIDSAGLAGMDEYSEQEQQSPPSAQPRVAGEETVGEELPPVEPPSAGFILQLFGVPAVIVLVLIGGYVLFSKVVSGTQDWRSLVAELRHENPHRRWRGALGLAQKLKADEEQGAAGQQLARNPQVAAELAGLLEEQLQKASSDPDDLKHQAFLARTLGFLDVPETTLPVLQKAMQSGHERQVRKNAIAAVALIANRSQERGRPLKQASLTEDLVRVTRDDDVLLKQLGAFALGFITTETAVHRLKVLLEDGDRNTRINAAVGLARQNSLEGYAVFKSVLTVASRRMERPSESRSSPKTGRGSKRFESLLALKNTLTALDRLAGEFSPKQRRELAALLRPIAEHHPETKIRLEAGEIHRQLSRQEPSASD